MSERRALSLNEEIHILQEAVAGLPRATAAHVHQAVKQSLQPVEELKPSLAALLKIAPALSSRLDLVSPEVRKLSWQLERPTEPTWLGWSWEEWIWLLAIWLLGANAAIYGVLLLIQELK